MIRVFALTFALTANVVFAEQPLEYRGPADLIIENAKIFLPGANHSALAIKSNKILAVGSRADMVAISGPNTARLDARGCSVADGIVWNQDLFSLPIDQVHTAKVLTTIFDCQVVYQSDK